MEDVDRTTQEPLSPHPLGEALNVFKLVNCAVTEALQLLAVDYIANPNKPFLNGQYF